MSVHFVLSERLRYLSKLISILYTTVIFGVSFFDLNTKQLTNRFSLDQDQRRLQSEATGVTVDGHTGYISMSNVSIVDMGAQPF